jgi:hypothetical protein
MERIRDSYPKNYITVKENLSYKINQKAVELQNKIDQKSNELSTLSSTLSVPVDTAKLNISDTKGYTAMFKILADKLNSSEEFQDSPINSSELEMWFFICLGIIFEIVAILTAYLAQVEANKVGRSETISHNNQNKVVGFTPGKTAMATNAQFEMQEGPKAIHEESKRIIGFRPDPASSTTPSTLEYLNIPQETIINIPDALETDDVKKYIEHMYMTANGNEARGSARIAKEIEMNPETARKIRGILEAHGIVKSDKVKKKTYILSPMPTLRAGYAQC